MEKINKNFIIGALIVLAFLAILSLPYVVSSGAKGAIEGAFASDTKEYTIMDEPNEETPVGIVMKALKSLDEPNTLATSSKLIPTTEVAKQFADKCFLYYTKEDNGRMAENYKLDGKMSVSDFQFKMQATSDMILRRLIESGYTQRINWPNIKFLGYTYVEPGPSVESHMRLYFADQGRVYKIHFRAIYIQSGEKFLSGAFFESDAHLVSMDDAGAANIKSFIRQLLAD